MRHSARPAIWQRETAYLLGQHLGRALTTDEISHLLPGVDARYSLLCKLLYGSGLRLMEAIRLRVQDIDFDYLSVQIWNGKGGKHRRVTLAREMVEPLKKTNRSNPFILPIGYEKRRV